VACGISTTAELESGTKHKTTSISKKRQKVKTEYHSVCLSVWGAFKPMRTPSAVVPAVALAAIISSTPLLAADIAVAPEPVAENLWYLSLFGGIKFGEDWDDSIDCHELGCDESFDVTVETENGWRASAAVGLLFSQAFAVEGELSYMTQDLGNASFDDCHECDVDLDGDVGIVTGMVNFIAGLPLGQAFRPYIGVGAGFAHVSLDDGDDFFDEGDSAFALQGIAGIDFALSENVALGVRGRLLHIGDLETDGVFDNSDFEHDIDLDLIPSLEIGITIGL
jgi:opacity protein-like surface antigen